MINETTVEWWAYLIGKIKADDLSEPNQLRLEQGEAVREAQLIVGEVPLKDWQLMQDEEE